MTCQYFFILLCGPSLPGTCCKPISLGLPLLSMHWLSTVLPLTEFECIEQRLMTKKPLTNDELNELTVGLNNLARNLWWTWNQGAQEIFQELSPRGWQNLYHNAVAILHEVSNYELRVRLQDLDFAQRVRQVLRSFDSYMNEKATWAS